MMNRIWEDQDRIEDEDENEVENENKNDACEYNDKNKAILPWIKNGEYYYEKNL